MTHEDARVIALEMAEFLNEKKARDIKILDVEEFSYLYDFIIIATGDSQLYLKSLARYLVSNLEELDVKPLNSIKSLDNPWILIDCGFIVIHLFTEEVRDFYSLEKLWPRALSIYEAPTVAV